VNAPREHCTPNKDDPRHGAVPLSFHVCDGPVSHWFEALTTVASARRMGFYQFLCVWSDRTCFFAGASSCFPVTATVPHLNGDSVKIGKYLAGGGRIIMCTNAGKEV